MAAVGKGRKKPKKDTSFATWKFELENTVSGDPKCDGNCLKVVRAYLDFMSSPKIRPYLSIINLKVATDLHDGAIVKARRTLETTGYFKADGHASSGAVKYHIVNSRRNIVLDHQTIKRETLKRFEAEKKEKERQKRKTASDRSAAPAGPLSPADSACLNDEKVCGFYRDRSAAPAGNNVYDDVEVISLKEEQGVTYPAEDTSSYALAHSGDESSSPLPIPHDDAEADRMIDIICEGFDATMELRIRMTEMLIAGVLSPSLAARLLGTHEEAA